MEALRPGGLHRRTRIALERWSPDSNTPESRRPFHVKHRFGALLSTTPVGRKRDLATGEAAAIAQVERLCSSLVSFSRLTRSSRSVPTRPRRLCWRLSPS